MEQYSIEVEYSTNCLHLSSSPPPSLRTTLLNLPDLGSYTTYSQ